MFHPLNRDSELFLTPILPFVYSSKTPDLKQGTYCFRITTTFTSLRSSQAGHVTKLWTIERERGCHKRNSGLMTFKTSKRSTQSKRNTNHNYTEIHSSFARLAKIKSLKHTLTGEGMQKQVFSYIAGGNVKLHNPSDRKLGDIFLNDDVFH